MRGEVGGGKRISRHFSFVWTDFGQPNPVAWFSPPKKDIQRSNLAEAWQMITPNFHRFHPLKQIALVVMEFWLRFFFGRRRVARARRWEGHTHRQNLVTNGTANEIKSTILFNKKLVYLLSVSNGANITTINSTNRPATTHRLKGSAGQVLETHLGADLFENGKNKMEK